MLYFLHFQRCILDEYFFRTDVTSLYRIRYSAKAQSDPTHGQTVLFFRATIQPAYQFICTNRAGCIVAFRNKFISILQEGNLLWQ